MSTKVPFFFTLPLVRILRFLRAPAWSSCRCSGGIIYQSRRQRKTVKPAVAAAIADGVNAFFAVFVGVG
jgi:hypothetical protein